MIPRLLISLALLISASCTAARGPREPLPTEKAFTVMTYNVNYGLDGDAATIAAVRKADADAVFLQETTPAWEAAIRESLHDRYPHMQFITSRGAGGMAILSKRPFTIPDTIPSPEKWFPAARVLLQTDLGKIQVLAVHLHPPVTNSGNFVVGYFTTSETRLREIQDYLATLESGLPTLIVGDFNEDEGQSTAFIKRHHLRDAMLDFGPQQDTWRWQTSVGTLRRTLDHIFYSPDLAPLNARVIHAGNSDHLPLVATFTRRGDR